MNKNIIIFLLIATSGFLIADFFVYNRASSLRTATQTALIDQKVDDVTLLRIERETGEDMELYRENQQWRIRKPYSGSIDHQAVMKLLDIFSLPILDSVSLSEMNRLQRTLASYGLQKPSLSVTIASAHAKDVVRFGDFTSLKDSIYAMVDGIDQIFVVSNVVFGAANVTAGAFRRRDVSQLTANSVVSFAIKKGSNELIEFSRNQDGWLVDGRRASTKMVESFLTSVLSARIENFVWPVGASNETDRVSDALLSGYGLSPDKTTTITFKGDEGAEDLISFGLQTGTNVYALVQDSGAIVTLPAKLAALVRQDERLFTDSRIFPIEARTIRHFSLSLEKLRCVLRKDDDARWRLESPIDAPADQQNVEKVLARILRLSLSDVVSEGGIEISFSTNSPKTQVSVESVLDKLRIEDFRSKEMLHIDPTVVKRLVRMSSNLGDKMDSVIYDRENRQWGLELGRSGFEVSVEGVEKVLSAITSLQALRVEDLGTQVSGRDEYGFSSPFLQLAIDRIGEDAVRRNILVGKCCKDGYYATIGSSDAVFVISEKTVEALSSPLVVEVPLRSDAK